ncbi:myosin-IIIb-like [Anneissia japonica]|uniref:myosin-IIIb-like n=1 Tax=Anneissia japonica TaxID=1529436 RepID=UPI001425A727|nr:myosin-IIIb-like [Anneissia japonica]
MSRPDIGKVDDLATLPNLDEKILLEELKCRYDQDKIYTYVGDILVAVNPFRDIGIYSKEFSEKYKYQKRTSNAPHIFAVSDAAYQAMQTGSSVGGKRNQCIVISGESGAGKTESTKLIIKQLIDICHGKSQLEQQILQVNPLLEAFGNAQTVMNDNSSRFGKYIQLKFMDGAVMGAKISEYLLEKSRVIGQNPEEENFHIFYYMFAGLSTEDFQKYKLKSAETYKYLTNGPGRVQSKSTETKKLFAELNNAMDLVGFMDDEKEDMFTILAAVLAFGQIEFDVNDNDAAFVKNPQAVQVVCDLLGMNKDELIGILTYAKSSAHGEVFQRNYTAEQARDSRDAMTKALYGRLFSWIVNKVNQLLAPEDDLDTSKGTEIGILDIFGFEHLHTNSFEQACINLANEQLQFFFNRHIFLLEQEEYKNEGVDWKSIPFVNNQPLLDLFLAKPIGIFALLDEESHFPKATDHSFVEKMGQNFAKNHHYIKAKVASSNNFSIDHYAGRVEYDANNFLEKNRDSLPNGTMQVFQGAENQLLGIIFKATISRTGTLALQRRSSKKSAMKSRKRRRTPKIMKAAASKKKLTVCAQFKNSLSVLMERLDLSNPHFIRCVKPNTAKTSRQFDGRFVTAQLRYTGMLETTRIRKLGYAVRPLFEDFVKRYRILALSPKLVTDNRGVVKILTDMKLTDWQIGKTKVFLKYYHQEKLEAKMIEMGKSAIQMQKIVRGFLVRVKFRRMLEVARREAREAKEFLEKMKQMALVNHQTQLKLVEHDKDIPADYFDEKNEPAIQIDEAPPPPPPPAVQFAPEATPLEDVQEEAHESGGETDQEDILEDEFVRTKDIGKFGAKGSRAASVRWFQQTQTDQVRQTSDGQFAPWFHGIITRRESERLLQNRAIGCFLIRVSESRFGYSLSMKTPSKIKHFMIDQLRNGKYVVVGELPVFRTLNEMVIYYHKNPVSPFGDFLTEPCGQETDDFDYAELMIESDEYQGIDSIAESQSSQDGYLSPSKVSGVESSGMRRTQNRLTSKPRTEESRENAVSRASYVSLIGDQEPSSVAPSKNAPPSVAVKREKEAVDKKDKRTSIAGSIRSFFSKK